MYYKFKCNECKNEEEIEMRMKDYTSEGHKCSKCGGKLERTIDSYKGNYTSCIGFYASSQSN